MRRSAGVLLEVRDLMSISTGMFPLRLPGFEKSWGAEFNISLDEVPSLRNLEIA